MIEAQDGYAKPDKSEIPEGLAEALPGIIDEAIDHVIEVYEDAQVEMTEMYKGELPGVTQQDVDDGRSDIVSRDVHDAVQATMPDLVRCFLGEDNVVEFTPGGQDDEQHALQATDAIRHIFQKENDAFRFIVGALKDGLVRNYAVAAWWHEIEDKSVVREYSLDQHTYAELISQPDVEVMEAKTTDQPDGTFTVDAKLKHVREEHRYIVELIPPEELVVSRRARDTKGEHFIGRRRNLPKAVLLQMGYDEALIDEHAGSDNSLNSSGVAAERNDDTTSQDGTDDEVLYVDGWLKWRHEDRHQLFKVCCMGSAHKIVKCEPADCVELALWTPDYEPHRIAGESQAQKVSDIQRLKTGIWRGVIDSLAEALVPRTEVVEGQVNIEDAMSTEIGGLVRVRAPGMVRPLSTPFLGQQAMPLLQMVDVMREERVGAFRAADGLTSEHMQSATKMAVAATISGSKAPKELLARSFAETFLKPIFKGLLRLFVENQDREKVIRLRGQWVPVDPRGWNAGMDAEVNVALALSTDEERVMQLAAISQKQEQILQTLGPANPLVTLHQYSNTLREMVRLTGRKNLNAYFNAVDPNWQPPQQSAPPDPAMVLADAQVKALQEEQQRKTIESENKMSLEERKLKLDDDFRRDELDQRREIEMAKIQAEFAYDTTAHEADIEADITKNREGLIAQTVQTAMQPSPGAPE